MAKKKKKKKNKFNNFSSQIKLEQKSIATSDDITQAALKVFGSTYFTLPQS